jgi:hypothetical protein
VFLDIGGKILPPKNEMSDHPLLGLEGGGFMTFYYLTAWCVLCYSRQIDEAIISIADFFPPNY